MNKFPFVFPAALLLVAVLGTAECRAQGSDQRYGVLIEGQFVQPTPQLSDRFGSLVTGAVGVGRWADETTYWEARLQRFAFRKGNVALVPDTTRPAIDLDSLELSLDIFGGGLFVHRRVGRLGALRPYASAGAGLYRWTDTRGAYRAEQVNVPEERRGQWSAGFHAAVGTEFYVMPRIAFNAALDYTIIMGELWPTLRLGLENVSTFQFATARVGLRYYW